MAADTSVVKPVDAPPLKPLSLKSKLAGTPSRPPKYPVTIKNLNGQEVVLKKLLLLEKGADLEFKDNYGRRPLSLAAYTRARGGNEATSREKRGPGVQG